MIFLFGLYYLIAQGKQLFIKKENLDFLAILLCLSDYNYFNGYVEFFLVCTKNSPIKHIKAFNKRISKPNRYP